MGLWEEVADRKWPRLTRKRALGSQRSLALPWPWNVRSARRPTLGTMFKDAA